MANNFLLTLDTTAPVIKAVGLSNSPITSDRETFFEFTLDNLEGFGAGYQYKIWGDVDPTKNPDIQALEVDSEWIDATSLEAETEVLTLWLSEGDGAKTILVRVRDDVWNESAPGEASTELLTSVPTITITAGPDHAKISEVPTKDESNFTFKSDEDLAAWKVEVVPEEGSAEGSGTVIPECEGGELEGEKNQAVKITGANLAAAVGNVDALYIVKVFGQSAANGLWSV